MTRRDSGLTLIEVVLSIGIIVMLFGGIYAVYIALLDHIGNAGVRAAAAGLLNREVETVRNLPYDKVGTVGGVPAGVLQALRNVTSSEGYAFVVRTTVRNIDDPFDGRLGGSPNDTAPADYRLVDIEVTCPSCAHFNPITLTTTVAPQNLESAGTAGSLFVNVFDANAVGVQGATVHLTNASVTPSIDLTDFTNASGVLQLVGVPTSTQRYRIVISKDGYSTDRTYAVGDPANPNPAQPDATVLAQTLTQVSFAIDRTSTMTVRTADRFCVPQANVAFSLTGAKTIGSSPTVVKTATSAATGADGMRAVGGLEWDTYALSFPGLAANIAGTIPFLPLVVDPGTSGDALVVLSPQTAGHLLVAVRDAASGTGVMGATVRIEGGGYDRTLVTGSSTVVLTDWSGLLYASQDGGMDTESIPGSVSLTGPPYATSTEHWLISHTLDAGGSAGRWYALRGVMGSIPPGTAARFQVAGNGDNATWDFVGPDGTGDTYFGAGGGDIPAAVGTNRYLRYKMLLSTTDDTAAPIVDELSFEFTGPCVPPAQALFDDIPAGNYTMTADAPGYLQATALVVAGGGVAEMTMMLNRP